MTKEKTIVVVWCIAGCLWNVAGLIAAIDHRTTTAVMNVAIGIMFIVIGLTLNRKGKGENPVAKPNCPLAVQPTNATVEDPATKLKQLKELKDSGVLTEDEYQSKRKPLIDKL